MTVVRSILYVVTVSIVLRGPLLGPTHVEAQTNSGQITNSLPVEPPKPAAQAPAKTIPLTVTSNVSDQVAIQAVLIPASLARRIFGKEVANNYAVVEVLVSNRDPQSSVMIHSIFLDYSQWGLSGEVADTSGSGPPSEVNPKLDSNQKSNSPSQVASVESRLVRGELLDAQPWTARNWVMRSLTAIGTVAVAFQFPFSTDVSKGIGAFNGTVVPGAQSLWPDGTINQINRISDVGFQTNKVIPKQSADVVVAFFPITRFLTPGFAKEFKKNPAPWFVPEEMLADPSTSKMIERFLKPLILPNSPLLSGDLRANMVKALNTCPSKSADDKEICDLKALLDSISLNRISVALDGAMTVDVATVPATIYSVDFKGGNAPTIWTTAGTAQTGTIKGVYLSGGVPSVVDASGDPIGGITTTPVTAGSTDTVLNFTMTIKSCIPSSQKVFFVVKKVPSASASANSAKSASTSEEDNSVPSTPFEFPVQPATDCSAGGTTGGQGGQGGSGQKPTPSPGSGSGRL